MRRRKPKSLIIKNFNLNMNDIHILDKFKNEVKLKYGYRINWYNIYLELISLLKNCTNFERMNFTYDNPLTQSIIKNILSKFNIKTIDLYTYTNYDYFVILLYDYEVLCNVCNGCGKVNHDHTRRCNRCNGKGKLDWIDIIKT